MPSHTGLTKPHTGLTILNCQKRKQRHWKSQNWWAVWIFKWLNVLVKFKTVLTNNKKSAYEPSGPSGWSLSQFPWHEVTESISTPLDGMLVHCRVNPSIKFAGTHLCTWLERGTVRVKCPAQKHNTMSLTRAQTRTARSKAERTNHEATTPPMITLKRVTTNVF